MKIKEFLDTVCNEIKYQPAKKYISEELESHMQEIKEDYINNGMIESDAEEKAVSQMGMAKDIGKKLNKIHKPRMDWKLLGLITILMGFSLLVGVLKSTNMYNKILVGEIIIDILIGLILSIGIYFFDYRKLKKHSFSLYLLATIIMILPLTGLGCYKQGVSCVYLGGGIAFFPATITIPIYIMAFIGFIVNYDKSNNIKLQICNETFLINKDFIKIVGLTAISLLLMASVALLTNTLILGFIYLVIITIKLITNEENRIRNLLILYGSLGILAIILIFMLDMSPFESTRILASFDPQIDPTGTGYIGMLQKEILQNSKIIGEADTEVISSDKYIISKESNYTFIYLLGKVGILISGMLVLAIILTSIKLIINAKNIKDQYGKYLIIGLSSLYIFQSLASVLMNINMGIQANINIPFVSDGGFYLIVNILSMAIIFSVYRRKDINFEEPKKSKFMEKVEKIFLKSVKYIRSKIDKSNNNIQ